MESSGSGAKADVPPYAWICGYSKIKTWVCDQSESFVKIVKGGKTTTRPNRCAQSDVFGVGIRQLKSDGGYNSSPLPNREEDEIAIETH